MSAVTVRVQLWASNSSCSSLAFTWREIPNASQACGHSMRRRWRS